MKTFAEILRETRIKRGIKQYQLADMVGVGNNTIWNYERGESVPNLYTAADIAKALGVSIDYLVYGEEVRKR